MLVWKAMPSITLMMSPILRLLAVISSMVVTTWPTTWPPLTATALAELASCVAWRALSALLRTMAFISSMEAAVCCRLLAWCSVRELRSRLPAAICELAVDTESTPERTVATTLDSEDCMSRAAASTLVWSPARVCTSTVRSPSAMRRSSAAAWAGSPPICMVTERAIANPNSAAITMPTPRRR